MVYRAGVAIPGMNFVAIDVETASSARHSICQIGLVRFQDGIETGVMSYLVNPECDFDDVNIGIHGIEPAAVAKKACLKDVLPKLFNILQNHMLVSHSAFDQQALASAGGRFGIAVPEFHWIDTVRVARDAWPDLENHKLDTVSRHLNFTFSHHDAGEDALASGHILSNATSLVGEWRRWVDRPNLSRWWREWDAPQARKPSWVGKQQVRAVDGVAGGNLEGEFVVFTGDLSIERQAAVDLAVAAGCSVRSSVSRKTTLLVVGQGGEGTGKMRAAKAAIASGQDVRIIDEAAFLALVNGAYMPNSSFVVRTL